MSNRQASRRRRAERGQRTPGAIAQPAWAPLRYRYAPLDLLSADQVESIHQTALTILEDIGIKVLGPNARKAFAEAGFRVDETEEHVHFDRAGVEELVAKAPILGDASRA